MDRFVPRDKLSKKERKKRDAEKRNTWAFSPVTRKIESKKLYNRKRISRTDRDDGTGDLLLSWIHFLSSRAMMASRLLWVERT